MSSTVVVSIAAVTAFVSTKPGATGGGVTLVVVSAELVEVAVVEVAVVEVAVGEVDVVELGLLCTGAVETVGGDDDSSLLTEVAVDTPGPGVVVDAPMPVSSWFAASSPDSAYAVTITATDNTRPITGAVHARLPRVLMGSPPAREEAGRTFA